MSDGSHCLADVPAVLASCAMKQDFRSYALRAAKRRGIHTQRALAEALEAHESTVSRLLHGKCEPTSDMLRRLSRVLGVRSDEILRRTSRAQPGGKR